MTDKQTQKVKKAHRIFFSNTYLLDTFLKRVNNCNLTKAKTEIGNYRMPGNFWTKQMNL